jgi:peptidyl-prolyl cis-trans isomerase A (cyclophilin A)
MKRSLCSFVALALLCSCRSAPPEPTSKKPASTPATVKSAPAPTASAAPRPPTPAPQPASPGDPLAGKFTLEDATKDLPGQGTQLVASLETELGTLECQLYSDKAPNTVANFVGLARGIRDWQDPDGKWVKRPAYDGTTFHRVIKGFMIQGGDPTGTGAGQPGYVINDEIWEGGKHDQRGLLCMANRGPNTNGAQFFILDAPAPHLTRAKSYTIFGKCAPEAVIEKLASVEVRGDHSVSPTKIKHVKILRK